MVGPALALIEFESIAAGIEAGDAMVKRSPVELILAGSTQPGKYVVLVVGGTAEVSEAVDAGLSSRDFLVDHVVLSDVHPDVVAAIRGARAGESGESLGIVETSSLSATVAAADAGRKAASVAITEIRLGDGLGGKAFCRFSGSVAEVQAAVDAAKSVTGDHLIRAAVIPRLHPEMAANLNAETRFSDRNDGLGA